VIAHELGHAFGLVHVSPDTRPSVMNPGNTTVAPNDGDRAALEALWGTCGDGS
jgi:predicted Zn-dependent protease